MSGRQDSSVTRAFDELKSQPIDSEQLALLQNIHKDKIGGHLGRGYAILGKLEFDSLYLKFIINDNADDLTSSPKKKFLKQKQDQNL